MYSFKPVYKDRGIQYGSIYLGRTCISDNTSQFHAERLIKLANRPDVPSEADKEASRAYQRDYRQNNQKRLREYRRAYDKKRAQRKLIEEQRQKLLDMRKG